MRAPEGLSRYLREGDKDRDKTGRFSEGSGLARYLPEARRAGSEDDTKK
ncbi:hypothetical protein PAB09_09480 [Corynebacterium sp. SCR221107]|nr:hypothetical protein [Corynebacterium sp. SCR221107]WBT08120.1 hypothetical protein PAB09_09480 [Corynebacterium sp. SCR221107]